MSAMSSAPVVCAAASAVVGRGRRLGRLSAGAEWARALGVSAVGWSIACAGVVVGVVSPAGAGAAVVVVPTVGAGVSVVAAALPACVGAASVCCMAGVVAGAGVAGGAMSVSVALVGAASPGPVVCWTVLPVSSVGPKIASMTSSSSGEGCTVGCVAPGAVSVVA